MTNKILLGPNEVRLLFQLEKEGKAVFSFEDAVQILGSPETVKFVIHRLKRKGRITRIERGKYVLAPARSGIEGHWSEHPFRIIPNLLHQYYVGFWTAMNYWGMTEQVPVTISVATTKRKKTIRYGGQKFKFVTLSKKKFFGFTQERIKESDLVFSISTREKTLADALVFPQYCGGMTEVTKAIWNSRKQVDWNEVVTATSKLGVDVAQRRLGYLLRLLRIASDVSGRLAARPWYGLRFLDPAAPKRALAYSREFGLIVNIDKSRLTSWSGT